MMSYLGYLNIKQILIPQDRSEIGKSCKELVEIYSKIKNIYILFEIRVYFTIEFFDARAL